MDTTFSCSYGNTVVLQPMDWWRQAIQIQLKLLKQYCCDAGFYQRI